MALDYPGTELIASLLRKLANLAGLDPSPALLLVLSTVVLALIIILLVLTVVPGFVWGMRKIMADIQSRHGPTRVGPFGLLQTLADGVKMVFKEDVIPSRADHFTFKLAPYLAIVPVLLAFAPLPWSQGVILSDVGTGILFILAIGAVSPLGEVFAGWGSNNKYALIGGLRAAAMDVSYEIPMVISAIAVVLLTAAMAPDGASALSTQVIVAAQQPWWFFVLQPLGVIIFFASAIAKIGVVPIDLPEAESELVAGYFTEYSGIRFGVFMLTVFANIFLMSAITVTLFFGGWALLPPFGAALVLLGLSGIILTRQPGTTVNVGPAAVGATVFGVVLTYLLGGFKGLGQGLITTAWSPQVAARFFGPGAPADNFILTLSSAWEFLVPAALFASLLYVLLVLAEKGTARDAAIFPAVAVANAALPPVAMLTLAPFLATGVEGGIVNALVGGLSLLILPIVPLVIMAGLLVVTALAAFLLVGTTRDVILGAALALIPGLLPLMMIPLGSFLLKALFFSFLVFWLWFTLPRVRVDQFLKIGWKTMFPLSLLTLLIAGVEAWLLRGGAL